MVRPRILFMGTPLFAVPPLRALVERGFDVVGVVTQPQKPFGRGGKLIPAPVKEFALRWNLGLLEPVSIREERFVNKLKSLSLDLIVVAAYGKMLPESVLGIPRFGCVNLHASILPSYRGAAPVNWAIIKGEKITGVTTMLMDAGMDTGPVLLAEKVEIGRDETAGELSIRLSEAGASLLARTVEFFLEGKITPAPQDDKKATYAPPLKKEDGRIDWNLSAKEMENRVRGLCPWPGAYTFWRGKSLKIHRGAAADGREVLALGGLRPGEVVAAGGVIVVGCGKGVFEIKELQLEGKRRMGAVEFLRGHRLGKEAFV
ncbi:MAG: methionyl-tRNA formyltransferase [Deltaproteobacteria bacterium]|nr:methionyl-tRNA formyltransferase [Deltaproteobacteria bacterium]